MRRNNHSLFNWFSPFLKKLNFDFLLYCKFYFFLNFGACHSNKHKFLRSFYICLSQVNVIVLAAKYTPHYLLFRAFLFSFKRLVASIVIIYLNHAYIIGPIHIYQLFMRGKLLMWEQVVFNPLTHDKIC